MQYFRHSKEEDFSESAEFYSGILEVEFYSGILEVEFYRSELKDVFTSKTSGNNS